MSLFLVILRVSGRVVWNPDFWAYLKKQDKYVAYCVPWVRMPSPSRFLLSELKSKYGIFFTLLSLKLREENGELCK